MDREGRMACLKDIAPAAENNINTQFIVLDKGRTILEGRNKTCLALVADETASVHFQFWGDECDGFEAGDIIRLANGIFSYSRNTNLVLRAGRRGAIEKVGEFAMVFVETPNMSEVTWIPDINRSNKRYLDARNWNVDKANKMLEETIRWRSAYKPEEICWHEVAVEGETGKIYRASFHDRQGRTVLILRPGMQNTKSIDNQMRHLTYLIENAVLNLPESQEQMAWLIDFTGLSISNTPPIKSARDTVNILQNHYPERLAVAFLYNPPRIFEAFWKIVKYFLDAKTFQKVKFVYPKDNDSVDLMRSYFDDENLPTELGGKATLKYDHEEFSRSMIEDDEKAAAFWGFDRKLQQAVNGHHGADGASPVS